MTLFFFHDIAIGEKKWPFVAVRVWIFLARVNRRIKVHHVPRSPEQKQRVIVGNKSKMCANSAPSTLCTLVKFTKYCPNINHYLPSPLITWFLLVRFPLAWILVYVHASGGISVLVESLVQSYICNFRVKLFFQKPKCEQCRE